MNLSKTASNIAALLSASMLTLSAAGCAARDPHFGLLGKSQGFVSAPINNKVDILWVIRNAGLMGPIQTNIANSVNSFMSGFMNKQFDYQMSVVTTDTRTVAAGGQDACIVGNPLIILPTTANPQNALATNANVGHFGDSNSENLGVISMALGAPNLTGCNNGFLRSDAYLAVIEVSDVDDPTATTAASAQSFLNGLKPPVSTPNGVPIYPYSVSAMVVENASDEAQCDAMGNTMFGTSGVQYSQIGTKILQLANATGGIIGDVCASDFSSSLLQIATHILEQATAVHLASVPDVSTLIVLENSTTITQDATNGWTYDPNTVSIVFHGNAIPTGPNVYMTVNYTPADVVR